MSAPITYTSTLSPQLMIWLDAYAAQAGMSKKAVIEEALTRYQIQIKKEKMIQMFKEASGDPEMLDLAESGLGDYSQQLNSYEQ